jgi:hypothetical protein
VGLQAGEDPVPGAPVDLELVEELPVEVGVAEPDHGAVEADRVERADEQLDDLDRAAGRIGADQLDADLPLLAHLAAARAHLAIDASGVAQAERPLAVAEPACGQSGDRDRHVAA